MEYANLHLRSDVEPFHIERRVSDKTIDIRPMASTLQADWTPTVNVGGFSGYCTNNRAQRWDYAEQPDAPLVRISRNGLNNQWYDEHGNRYVMGDRPIRFHDYNR